MPMTIGEIIRAQRDKLNLSQADVANRIGVTRQTVQQWEHGKTSPKRSISAHLAAVLEIAPQQIDPLFTSGVVSTRLINLRSQLIDVKTLSQLTLKLGGDLLHDDHSSEKLEVPAEAGKSFALRVTDDSMSPDYLTGDTLVVSATVTPRNGDCVVAAFEGDATVLRNYIVRGRDKEGFEVFDLATPSPDYATLTVNSASRCKLLGVVIELRRARRL